MFCPKCGVENVEGVQLCKSCSWVLASTSVVEVCQDAKTSGLAITSLVLTILVPFTFLLTTLPAIIFGIVALVKIEKSGGRLKGKGLAIAGIAAPAILLPVCLMLLAIMMPALGKARGVAQRIVCETNLKGISNAMEVYAFDNDGKYPTASKWCDLLVEHAEIRDRSFICPEAGIDGPSHYVINANAERLGKDAPPRMVLVFETDIPGWNLVGGIEMLKTANHQGDGCNVLFVNGHVEFVKIENVSDLRWSEDDFEQEAVTNEYHY